MLGCPQETDFFVRQDHNLAGLSGAHRAGITLATAKNSVALSVIALLVTGWHMVGILKSTLERAFFFNLHKSLGIVIAIFVVALIAWRIRHEPPPLPSAMPRWEKPVGTARHVAMEL
jgi:Prokaryotic cytochrome b561